MDFVLFLLSISLKLKTCLKIQLENSLSMWLISKTKKYEFKRKKLRHILHMLCTFMENIIIEPKFFEACLRSSPTTLSSSSSHWDSVFPTHNNLLQLTLTNYRPKNCVDNQAFKNGYFSSLISGDWKMAKVGNTVKILPSNLKTLNGRRWRNGSIVWAFVLFKFGKASKVVEAFFWGVGRGLFLKQRQPLFAGMRNI